MSGTAFPMPGTEDRRLSLLDRPPTVEEREAELEEPRPGVWAGETGADLRALTQEQTDALIRAQLHMRAHPAELEAVKRALGGVVQVTCVALGREPMYPIWSQRGGIDSDAFVRVLAWCAWGDRDRRWFERRSIRNGDRLTIARDGESVALVWTGEQASASALADVQPGGRVLCKVDGADEVYFRASFRPREKPAHLVALDRRDRALGQLPPQARIGWVSAAMDRGVSATDLARMLAARIRITDDDATALAEDLLALETFKRKVTDTAED